MFYTIRYSAADAYEYGLGWNLFIDGNTFLFGTKEEAEAAAKS